MRMDTEAGELPQSVDNDDDGLPGLALDQPLELLTPAEYAFAEHWLKKRNQIKAYRHAYPGTGEQKAKKLAPALLRQPRIQREIRRIYERWIDHSALDLSRIESELARIGLSDFRRAFDPQTGEILPPHQIDPDTAAAVSSYTETEDTRTHKLTRRIRFFDKGSSLRTLLEMRGALQDPAKGKGAEAPKAVFHFHIAGMPARALAGNVTVTSPSLPDAIDGRPPGALSVNPASLPRLAKRAKLQRGAAQVRQASAKAREAAQRPPGQRAKAVRTEPSPGGSQSVRQDAPLNGDISTDQGRNGGKAKQSLFTAENST